MGICHSSVVFTTQSARDNELKTFNYDVIPVVNNEQHCLSFTLEYSSLKAHTAKFFSVKDHLSDGVLFLLDVDQAPTTDKV